MLQQPGRLRRHFPLALGSLPPLLHQCPDPVDLLGELVLLVAVRQSLGSELQLALLVLAASLPGLEDRRVQLRLPAPRQPHLRGDAFD